MTDELVDYLQIRTKDDKETHFRGKSVAVYPRKYLISLNEIVDAVALRSGRNPQKCWGKVKENLDNDDFEIDEKNGDILITFFSLKQLVEVHLNCTKSWAVFSAESLDCFKKDFYDLCDQSRDKPEIVYVDDTDDEQTEPDTGAKAGGSGVTREDKNSDSQDRLHFVSGREKLLAEREKLLAEREEQVAEHEEQVAEHEMRLSKKQSEYDKAHQELLDGKIEHVVKVNELDTHRKEFEKNKKELIGTKRSSSELSMIANKLNKIAKQMQTDSQSKTQLDRRSTTPEQVCVMIVAFFYQLENTQMIPNI